MRVRGKRDPERTLALVAGWRTPFCKAGTELAEASAADLATHCLREVLDRTGFPAAKVDEVILGCAGPDAREANVARVAALRAGLPLRVPAVTVMRNCASGMEAVLAADLRVLAGSGEVFVVGGTESMSGFPLLMGQELKRFFERLGKSRSATQKLLAMLRLRPQFLKPRIALLEGLTDPVTGLLMGSTAENVARRLGISRAAQDEFALRSHRRAAAARARGRLLREIAPLAPPPRFPAWVQQDNGVREDQSAEQLGRLRPVFDRQEGDVTVGNSCQVTDGAVALLVMSEARARAEGLKPLALLRGSATVALDPAVMGLGPAHAIPQALADAGLSLSEIDRFEINEAFAAQVLGCVLALESDRFCREALGLPHALGAIDPEKLNCNGGAIALGHPIAASGARLALTLAHELAEHGARFGVASLCVGGGQGQAMVWENAA
jgi:acetyl-CoA acetyltransferase family protein